LNVLPGACAILRLSLTFLRAGPENRQGDAETSAAAVVICRQHLAVVHDDDASARGVLLDAARSTDVEVRTVALNLLLHFHIEEGGVV